ncbi:MFS transporter [Spiroplasma endosymbiont of Megaselia nigra]|uniref:MFS transporter n=1 Tax=Spiroplasma endosymbiont of Megaselia nigra TaxID=2478537 RepID=UPI000F888FBA|nr:MFS transporter [Spiroplasma endosymbiont of Megaselia nigra]RUO86653.1 MFS transporter [Spiroplasma endosymbiont of Megaselia nigra]
MEKLRRVSLTFLTIGGIFSALLFGILIMLANKINNQMFLYNAAYMLLHDIALLFLQFSNMTVYHNVMTNPELIGGILIGISSFLVLLYLIPNYLSKNNGYKIFGISGAFVIGLISCILLTMAVVLAGQPISAKTGLNIFKLNLPINSGFILLFIGPVLTFFGSCFAIAYYHTTRKAKSLTQDQKNRLTAINFETGKIGARGLTPQKEMVNQAELTPIEETKTPLNNKSVATTNDLKAKMALLKAKMARNSLLHEQGEAHLVPEKENNNYDNSKPTIRVGAEGQYLRTIKEGEGIVDESPAGLLIEKEGDFVKKGDIIKHRDYSALIFSAETSSSKGNFNAYDSIIIPKSKQHMSLDKTELAERIGSVPKPSGKQRINPNARVDSSYDGKVFLGDIDKIWKAGKKYREDITKKPATNNSLQSSDLHHNFENENENDDKIDYNH